MDRVASGAGLQIAILVALAGVGVGVPLACGVGAQRIPAVIQCEIDALKVLPKDPQMATVYDARDLVERVRACTLEHGDAGP
jgi:succinyl-CoA synthetase alpha subunit